MIMRKASFPGRSGAKTLYAAILASIVALAGCSTGTGPGSSSEPHTNHGGSASASAPAASADHNAADVAFAQMMIPHHMQAVEMSDIMLAKAELPPAITSLATRIKAAQGPEIETMTGWLKSWNQPTQMPPGHSMPGMMGDDDISKLKAAQGTEAARLFLNQMIAHHEGAVTMARTETSDGKNSDAVALSKAIVTAQEAEIKEMKDLLGTL